MIGRACAQLEAQGPAPAATGRSPPGPCHNPGHTPSAPSPSCSLTFEPWLSLAHGYRPHQTLTLRYALLLKSVTPITQNSQTCCLKIIDNDGKSVAH